MVQSSTEQEKQERRDTIEFLRHASPEALIAESEQATIRAFHRQLRDVPAYRSLFSASHRGDAEAVADIAAFKRVAPILDKHNTFGTYSIRDLCRGGSLQDVRSILTSSGHSGVFSFGVNTSENLARSSRSIDAGLQYIFNVDERPTLLINALPMGVKVNTKATVLAETSVRDDMVYALVKKFAPAFEQIVIVAEGSFAKKIVEDGAEYHGIDWTTLPVSLITGEEGIAENYRSYMADRLGIDDLTRRGGKLIMSSMGVAELDLNIFHETTDTIAIRRLANTDAALRQALFGRDAKICPMLFAYYPMRCYVEELPAASGRQSELVLSMLSEEMKIPLLRYRSGDLGHIIGYGDMVRTLSAHGSTIVPDYKLPFVAVGGRGKAVTTDKGTLTPEEVKEALYADWTLPPLLTGNFRMSAGERGSIDIDLQLRRDKTAPKGVEEHLLGALAVLNPVPVNARFHPYQAFPHMMEVDWERKFRYI